MEFLNWAAEHYWLFFFMLLAGVSACHGLGRLGSTHQTIIKPSDED